MRAARLCPLNHAWCVVNQDSGAPSADVGAAAPAQQALVEDVVRHDEEQRLVLRSHGRGRGLGRSKEEGLLRVASLSHLWEH